MEAVSIAGEALVLDADVADQMGCQLALRVDPVPSRCESRRRQAEADHRAPLGVRCRLSQTKRRGSVRLGEQPLHQNAPSCDRRLLVEHARGSANSEVIG